MKTLTTIPKMQLLIICALPGVGKAQNPHENILIMHNAAGIQEYTVVIDVAISNYFVVPVSQFDVSLPPGFTYVAGLAVLNQVRKVNFLICFCILTGINILGIGSLSLINPVLSEMQMLSCFTL